MISPFHSAVEGVFDENSLNSIQNLLNLQKEINTGYLFTWGCAHYNDVISDEYRGFKMNVFQIEGESNGVKIRIFDIWKERLGQQHAGLQIYLKININFRRE